jgi:hypothetical protein
MITKQSYLEVKIIIKDYETQQLNISGIIGSSIPKPPEPPLNRVLREGVGHFCSNCCSTSSKVGYLGLFGERLCDNKKCSNSKSKKNYQKQIT